MLHADRHPIRVYVLDDLTMLIGPGTAGQLLEIGVARADGTDLLVHAMDARPRALER